MASFKAVLWQTGLEQYPMLTDAARDSISKLMTLGSRLAIYSQDVAWDFCDATSPDYTLDRKTLVQQRAARHLAGGPHDVLPRFRDRVGPDQRRIHRRYLLHAAP